MQVKLVLYQVFGSKVSNFVNQIVISYIEQVK